MFSRCGIYAVHNARWLNAFGLRRWRSPLVQGSTCLAVARPGDCSSGSDRSKTVPTPAQPTQRSPPPPPKMEDDKSQSIFQRFKNVAKKYWYILLPVHLVTSTVWFGSFYFVASSGVNVPALLESLGFPNWVVDKVKNGNSWTSYLLIAYGLYKIFTPLRYMVTLACTGMTIRYLQRLGYTIGKGGPKK